MNIPKKIGQFTRYIGNPSTMKYGYYYQCVFSLPFSKEKQRMVRVWLPEDYDFSNPNKRYPVIYMSDGQNLVDRYLSAFGEWELDKTVHQLMKDKYSGVIAVGIDCPKDSNERGKELCPPYPPRSGIIPKNRKDLVPCADKYIDYIVNDIKPIIDELFYTISDKEHTAIGGSSMGGIMAFFAYIYRPDIFGFSLSFSPAFFFYLKNNWFEILDSYHVSPDKNGKLFIYVGGKEFEAKFLTPTCYTYYYFVRHGFKNDQVALLVDSEQIHHEGAWAKYLPNALTYWLKSI